MNITVFGTGYVGLVTGVCFAELGNSVQCVDVDINKIAQLKKGISPIYEPGLDQLIHSNLKAGRVHFTTEFQQAIHSADILIIAVGTPPQSDGSADLTYVLKVAQTIGQNMQSSKLIVTKSTVPIGTFKLIKNQIQKELDTRKSPLTFDVASNPEFLREGCAIEDCLKPNRIVFGCETEKASEILKSLYRPFVNNDSQIIAMDPASSEMTKYAANSMLATKISLMNEFSRVCEKVGADIEHVRNGIGSDHRIGPYFINAGIGYGGSCFPKDVSALIQIGHNLDENLEILKAVESTNQLQRQRFIQKIISTIESLKLTTITLWGVAFKPGTDDIREAPALDIIEALLQKKIKIQIYDPVASAHAQHHFNNNSLLTFYEHQYEALKNSDLLIIPTEWLSFKEPDFQLIKKSLNHPLIFDGRNIYQPQHLKN